MSHETKINWLSTVLVNLSFTLVASAMNLAMSKGERQYYTRPRRRTPSHHSSLMFAWDGTHAEDKLRALVPVNEAQVWTTGVCEKKNPIIGSFSKSRAL